MVAAALQHLDLGLAVEQVVVRLADDRPGHAELPRAVRLLEYQQADVLSAYRFDRTSEGFVRTLYSFVYNTLIRLLFGLDYASAVAMVGVSTGRPVLCRWPPRMERTPALTG